MIKIGENIYQRIWHSELCNFMQDRPDQILAVHSEKSMPITFLNPDNYNSEGVRRSIFIQHLRDQEMQAFAIKLLNSDGEFRLDFLRNLLSSHFTIVGGISMEKLSILCYV